MMNYRFLVGKREAFRTAAESLLQRLCEDLRIADLQSLEFYDIYDIYGATATDLELLKNDICTSPATDEIVPDVAVLLQKLALDNRSWLAWEFLPTQFDQRAASAEQSLLLLRAGSGTVTGASSGAGSGSGAASSAGPGMKAAETANLPRIRTGFLVVFTSSAPDGRISPTDYERIRDYLINPVECRVKDMSVLTPPALPEAEPVPTLTGFIKNSPGELAAFKADYGLAMTRADLEHVQKYFRDEERRDPTETEIRVLDTYWSDHCRHTTFETELTDIAITPGPWREEIESALLEYTRLREFNERTGRPVTLMDMATSVGRAFRREGRLDDWEVSDEINACTIEVDLPTANGSEPWLIFFKNETHNHPTEIEPFGGAATCLGGIIRDPLSGRGYVYQAMRISGAADTTAPLDATLPGKLPQSVISRTAADGFSSYGNQIGLPSTYLKEIYHPGYVAKRLEAGAVVAAAPRANVQRGTPTPGDLILLVGGPTGRDGIGGATGSSKKHTSDSLDTSASQVQKGNPPEERKLQRLFRRHEAARLIKKCNDFGAGGVSVAVGELADGLNINLDVIRVKYPGLNGTELAISESQERMAIMIDPADLAEFTRYATEEDLLITQLATVTAEPRLVINWRGQRIVDMSRTFLNTNGVRQEQIVRIAGAPLDDYPYRRAAEILGTEERAPESDNAEVPDAQTLGAEEVATTADTADFAAKLYSVLTSPNVASQKRMALQFDSTIGRTTVLLPWGGVTRRTEEEGSVQLIPQSEGDVTPATATATVLTHGYDPELSHCSPFLGAMYSVVEACARQTALGADYTRARLSNQEFFPSPGKDPERWGLPAAALLGLIKAQLELGTPSIGGKDSMSGTFNDIDVPPTLITFAVTLMPANEVISAALPTPGLDLYLAAHRPLTNGMPNFPQLRRLWQRVRDDMRSGDVVAASTVKSGGLAEAVVKMAIGNNIGIKLEPVDDWFAALPGSLVIASNRPLSDPDYIHIGRSMERPFVKFPEYSIPIDKAAAWLDERYAPNYPDAPDLGDRPQARFELPAGTEINPAQIYQDVPHSVPSAPHGSPALHLKSGPRVLLPVFYGTNGEYDLAAAFAAAGGRSVEARIANRGPAELADSLAAFAEQLDQSQILALAGGFASGVEPGGAGRFVALALRNERVAAAIERFLARGGLILGIANGFQALLDCGLLPWGKITPADEPHPILFRNASNRHRAAISHTVVRSNRSPWLADFAVGEQHSLAFSHDEGRFMVAPEVAAELFANDQIATQYCRPDGSPTMDPAYNPNGSDYAVEGLTSPDGQIFGKMGQAERYIPGLYRNVPGQFDQNIFRAGVRYFAM